MKTYYVLPLCLLSGFASAAGIYEVDRSQWESKPAAAATKPVPRTATASTRTGTQAAPQDAAQTPSAAVPPQAAPGADMAQTCQPGHACNDLQ